MKTLSNQQAMHTSREQMNSAFRSFAIPSMWLVSFFTCFTALMAETNPKVMIDEQTPYVEVDHHGVLVKVNRIQDTENRLIDDFTKTSRPCPPFCIHPMKAAEGVRTVGEIELLEFVQNSVASNDSLLVDARMPEWYESETIPGSVNIPFVIFTNP